MNIYLKSTYTSVHTSTTAPECIFNLSFTMGHAVLLKIHYFKAQKQKVNERNQDMKEKKMII